MQDRAREERGKGRAYFQITGKVEETDEPSYTNKSTGEVVTKVQLSLIVPGMQDRVRCELPLADAPKADLLSRWELEENWVVVSAVAMGALSFERTNVRPGQEAIAALVVFPAREVGDGALD